mmetsp:Transcript_45530/g.97617  ORF Transcript_45530/g.97617 Transcript_45530/m.97617 type:complete len:412 (+) Transcript_45530:272-1507(+)
MIRTQTFFVQANDQRVNLEQLQRREQRLAETYHRSKPLVFNSSAYQRTHPVKVAKGKRDADVTCATTTVLGVADGVSQIEEYGIDPSLLPKELLRQCEKLATDQLYPDQRHCYSGPINIVHEAYNRTAPILGSTTLVLALLDNHTRIHGRQIPMIAVLCVGDCEMVILRRLSGDRGPLCPVFQTEMQRIDGHLQTPLQLARVDARIDPYFSDAITHEVIEHGSAVHMISAYEGDIIVLGSDGVFDNLFIGEIADIVNQSIPPGAAHPIEETMLAYLAQRIVEACHKKSVPGPTGFLSEAPIGVGGKIDDTSCVVAEVVCRQAYYDRIARDQVHPPPLSAAVGKDKLLSDSEDEAELNQSLFSCGHICGTMGMMNPKRSSPTSRINHSEADLESTDVETDADEDARGLCRIA